MSTWSGETLRLFISQLFIKLPKQQQTTYGERKLFLVWGDEDSMVLNLPLFTSTQPFKSGICVETKVSNITIRSINWRFKEEYSPILARKALGGGWNEWFNLFRVNTIPFILEQRITVKGFWIESGILVSKSLQPNALNRKANYGMDARSSRIKTVWPSPRCPFETQLWWGLELIRTHHSWCILVRYTYHNLKFFLNRSSGKDLKTFMCR